MVQNALKTVHSTPPQAPSAPLARLLGIPRGNESQLMEALPFAPRDVTAGTENEFQTAVTGPNAGMDLVKTIESSNYYQNLIRRARSGEFSPRQATDLERFLAEREGGPWENSWVRFPEQRLNTYARHIFRADLKSDKADPASPQRKDAHRFRVKVNGESFVRVPVSYLLKLSLAHVIGSQSRLHPLVRIAGERMMGHFLNDNSSPEILSFHPVRSGRAGSIGAELARETLIRFLFTQWLIEHAQEQFQLSRNGQEVKLFFSASPPRAQQELNGLISDSFYRELFMSPCLSGWPRGEEKHSYMHLCHQVLSRSRLNAVSKLREAGIITSNLVVMPQTSSTSLANNGTHISLGSRKLTRLLKDPASGFTPAHEKYLGDLVIKIAEHFLCLFPGTYAASPCRLGFQDFHPEKILGFLPHELDFTHLRMLWRRWKGKARLQVLGRSLTPFGPAWLDRSLSRLFRLKGDFVPDYRPIDYLVALMGTDQSPGLDGRLGNSARLMADLSQMGVFDPRMSFYQLIKLREFRHMGFSGFEHRYHSIFEHLPTDMAGATDLQALITALAVKYALTDQVGHRDIPDDPEVESERRQFFFAASIDLPTVYVKTQTRNRFLVRILKGIPTRRTSRRYPGYTRIPTRDYKMALVAFLKEEAGEFIRHHRMAGILSELEIRIKSPGQFSASGKLVRGILGETGHPMDLPSREFNERAEAYYMDELRLKQMNDGFNALYPVFRDLELWAQRDPAFAQALGTILGSQQPLVFLKQMRRPFLDQSLPPDQRVRLMNLIILHVNKETKDFERHHRAAGSPSIR